MNNLEKSIEEPIEPSEEPTTMDRLLASPDIQRAISQIPDLIKTNIEAKNILIKAQIDARAGVTRGTTKGILFWSATLALIIVVPVSVLSWYGKISSDAGIFLFGTLVGAAFTFLRNFFPRGG